MTNQFRDGFTDRADCDLEDGVDTCSDFLHKDICATSLGVWLWLLSRNRLTVLVVLRG